jgi:nitronate monooxygenase
MTLHTAFTELFGITHPIALAPMSGTAGGALAAAVSGGGGLGLVGAGLRDREWTDRELALVVKRTGNSGKPWGVGFLSWSDSVETVRRALEFGPDAVLLAFGDPAPLAAPVLDSEALLIVQVTDLAEARQAAELGADVIVAQGTEAGGHGRGGGTGGGRGTLAFVPAVVDLVDPIPVLAAGGIADGRGVAAALALGAAGALVGTRFQASAESLADPAVAKAIVEASGEDTERGRVLDVARGAAWPERYPGRSLRNDFLDTWRGKEAELAADEAARARFAEAADRGDLSAVPVWAGEAAGLITGVEPAADLVARLSADAETALARVLR